MRVGDYVRTKDYQNIRSQIGKIIKQDEKYYYLDIDEDTQIVWEEDTILKSSPNILKLLEPMDLLYVDIDGGFEGGIIVPRIPETQNELNKFIGFIKSGQWILKDVVTHEQLKSRIYEVK